MTKEKPDLCPKCSSQVIFVEYPYDSKLHYDGVSEFACKDVFVWEGDAKAHKCDWRVGRWCGKELKKGEAEPPFCEGKKHPKI